MSSIILHVPLMSETTLGFIGGRDWFLLFPKIRWGLISSKILSLIKSELVQGVEMMPTSGSRTAKQPTTLEKSRLRQI